MNEENETVYLEDLCEEVIGDGLQYLLENKNTVKPGSDEYTDAVHSIKELYDVRIRYTEAQMKYDDSEAQRQHELKLKRLEYEKRMEELKAEQEAKYKTSKEEDIIRIVELGTSIVKACLESIIPTMVYKGLADRVIVSEYQHDKYFNTSSWKIANSGIQKKLK